MSNFFEAAFQLELQRLSANIGAKLNCERWLKCGAILLYPISFDRLSVRLHSFWDLRESMCGGMFLVSQAMKAQRTCTPCCVAPFRSRHMSLRSWRPASTTWGGLFRGCVWTQAWGICPSSWFAGLHFFHVFCKLHGTCGTAAFPPRNFDSSQAAFEEMRKRDPYRLTSLDTYSNILFVKDVREVDGWRSLCDGCW